MTEIANQLRALVLDKHVNIMCLGDPIKSLLLPLWATPTLLPHVHHRTYTCGNVSTMCNIWDIPPRTDAAHRMFPLDGTPYTGFDFCIIVYDVISRLRKDTLDNYIDTKEQLTNQQHVDRPCKVVILILTTPRTPKDTYIHIINYAKSRDMHCIPVDNTHEGLKKISEFTQNLCQLVMTDRQTQLSSKVDSILNASASVKNG
jgi:hypothetical protein